MKQTTLNEQSVWSTI